MFLEEFKSRVAAALRLEAPVFSYPPRPELGNLSLACFGAAQERQEAPAVTAAALAVFLNNDEAFKQCCQEIKAVGPYINFYFRPAYLAGSVLRDIRLAAGEYGYNQTGSGRKVMLEYSNGNTHKEYHIGHLRNISYGHAVKRLLTANGWQALPVSYINDFGIHVAKTIWGWRRHPEYEASSEPRGYLLGRCYAAASQELIDNEAGKQEVVAIMKEIESRQGDNYRLWERTRQWSIDYFDSIYRELGIYFHNFFYESKLIAAGQEIVDDLVRKGILKKSEGAIIADLEPYGLGVLPIIRSDGTALYPVADLALAKEKFSRYGLDESIYIVDVRQSLYFKQLFHLIGQLGQTGVMRHLTYDFVTLPEGMMASRTGNVVTYTDLMSRVKARLTEETRRRHPDWPDKRVGAAVQKLAVATVKFEMIKVSADRIITFNIEEALRFDGFTACYLQYGYVRLRRVLQKGGWRRWLIRPDFSRLSDEKEMRLLIMIARYPEVVAAAGQKYNPSELAKFLFELVQAFNDYYQATPILKAAGATRSARLALIKGVARVLENGYRILGMQVLDEM